MSSSQDNFVSTGNATSWGPASQAGSEGQSGNTTTESEGQPENTVTKSEEQPGNTTTEYEGQLGTRPLTHLERIIQAASAGGALHKKTRAALQENSASQDPENNPGLETLTHLERIQRISRDNYAARNYSPYILPANIRSSESQRGSSTRGRQRSQGRGGLNRTRGRGSQSNPPASPLSSDGENPQAAVGTSSTDPNSETTPVYTHEDAHAAYLRSHPGAGNISHVPSTMIHIARASGIPPEVSERLYNQEGDQTMYSPKQLIVFGLVSRIPEGRVSTAQATSNAAGFGGTGAREVMRAIRSLPSDRFPAHRVLEELENQYTGKRVPREPGYAGQVAKLTDEGVELDNTGYLINENVFWNDFFGTA